jgi:aspartate aminotransferase
MQATRAANNGQPEAANALAQLSNASANLGIGAMAQDAQSSLLLDVLQQLSAASMGRTSHFSSGDTRAAHESRDMWSSVPTATLDSFTQIETAYEEDASETKLNLTVPGFRENSGKVFLPPTMRHAEKRLREENLFTPGVISVHGYEPFLEAGTRFGYGEESHAFKNQRIAAIQAVSITGALRLASGFLSRFPAPVGNRAVYVPSPSVDEDVTALREGGLEVKHYRFLDQKTGAVDWDGMKEDLQLAPPRSVILLHVSGSTPTGVELTAPQWRMLTTLLQGRQLIPLVIMAFQGLASGDTGRDAQPLRFMVHEKLPVVLIQSFDAMMGLYADSPAILSVAAQNTDGRDRISSQLRHVARAMYLHPPLWGAQLAHMVLSDPKLYPAW